MLKRYNEIFLGVALILDAVLVTAAWMVCYYFRFRLELIPYLEPVPPGPEIAFKVLPIVLACDILAIAALGLYRVPRTRSQLKESVEVTKGAVLGWLITIAGLYFYSRTRYGGWIAVVFFFANIAGLIGSRSLLRGVLRVLHARGIGVRSVAIIGTGRLAQKMLQRLQSNPRLGLRVQYFIDDDAVPGRGSVFGVPVRGGLPDLVECLKQHPVDMAFVAVSSRRPEALDRILDALLRLPINVAVVPDFRRAVTLNLDVCELGGMPVVQLRETPICGWRALAKRAVDIAGALLLLALFAVPMLIFAALVKLTSRGPVLFKQERMSFGGRPFTMLKFRSMSTDAEKETGPVWAPRDDPRRTQIGAVMRRTSFDELPQLFNVLRGDMSLVGPRPERPHFVQQFMRELPAYMLRHNVKAGLTGWAQVNGLRGNTSLKKRLQYDLYYINNWSLGLDFLILLLTPFSGLVSRHAY